MNECSQDDQELFQEMIENEYKALEQINNPNVVKVFRTSKNGQLVKANGQKRSVMYILMEFCSGGELFDFISHTGKFREEIARFYFK